jgi:hypothetical protein
MNVCERAEFSFSSWRQSTWDALRKYCIAYDFRAKKGLPYGSTLCQLHGAGQLQPKQPTLSKTATATMSGLFLVLLLLRRQLVDFF